MCFLFETLNGVCQQRKPSRVESWDIPYLGPFRIRHRRIGPRNGQADPRAIRVSYNQVHTEVRILPPPDHLKPLSP